MKKKRQIDVSLLEKPNIDSNNLLQVEKNDPKRKSQQITVNIVDVE